MIMSNRKGSLQHARACEGSEKPSRQGTQRQRKSSVNLSRTSTFEQANPLLNLNNLNKNCPFIGLDESATNKLVFVKRLEKLEKEAIKQFYENQIQSCFECLDKCLRMVEGVKEEHGMGKTEHGMGQTGITMQSMNRNFSEHLLYIRYLQAEFKFKLKDFPMARQYQQKSTKIINRLSKTERNKSSEYILSLGALDALLLQEQGKNKEAMKKISDLCKDCKLSEKISKQLNMCRVQCLVALQEQWQAIDLIRAVLRAQGDSQGQRGGITLKEECELIGVMARCFQQLGRMPEAEEQLQRHIEKLKRLKDEENLGSEATRNESKMFEGSHRNSAASSLSKTYQTYVGLYSQNQLLRKLYLARKWAADCERSDLAIAHLFHFYYQIGDLESALTQYAEISDSYKRTSEDWEVLAQIKLFYGERESAEFMFERAHDLAKGPEQRLLLEIRLLELGYEFESNKKEKLKGIDRKIKQNRHRHWAKDILIVYGEFLQSIGQTARLEKLSALLFQETDKMLRTRQGSHDHRQSQEKKEDSSQAEQLIKTGKFGPGTLKLLGHSETTPKLIDKQNQALTREPPIYSKFRCARENTKQQTVLKNLV